MKIDIRKLSKYTEVTIRDGNVTIELGLMDKEELKKLQEVFLDVSSEISSIISD
jgi:hypothetical protein